MPAELIYAVARDDIPGRPVDICLHITDAKGRVVVEELHAIEHTAHAAAVRKAARAFLQACCAYAQECEGEPVVIREIQSRDTIMTSETT